METAQTAQARPGEVLVRLVLYVPSPWSVVCPVLPRLDPNTTLSPPAATGLPSSSKVSTWRVAALLPSLATRTGAAHSRLVWGLASPLPGWSTKSTLVVLLTGRPLRVALTSAVSTFIDLLSVAV